MTCQQSEGRTFISQSETLNPIGNLTPLGCIVKALARKEVGDILMDAKYFWIIRFYVLLVRNRIPLNNPISCGKTRTQDSIVRLNVLLARKSGM